LDHSNRAVGGADGLLQDRPELLAWTAPRCPEIDDDRRVERAVDDFGHEIGGSDVLYRGGSRAADQRFARHQSSLRFYPTTWRHSRCMTSGSRRWAQLSVVSGSRSRPARSTIRGTCPAASIKRSRSAAETAVVRSLTSG